MYFNTSSIVTLSLSLINNIALPPILAMSTLLNPKSKKYWSGFSEIVCIITGVSKPSIFFNFSNNCGPVPPTW